MAVNSKADKTHSHKSTGLKAKSYASMPAPLTGAMTGPTEPAVKPGNALGTAGTKALMFRAKKELAPLEDPSQAPST